MKSYESIQKQMLRDLRQAENWIPAQVNIGEAERIHFVSEIKIPRNADYQTFYACAYNLIHDLGLGFDMNLFTLKRDGEDGGLLFSLVDPEIVHELVTSKKNDIKSMQFFLDYCEQERKQNPAKRSKQIESFQREMKDEISLRYYVFDGISAVRVGATFRQARRNHLLANDATIQAASQEQADESLLREIIDGFQRSSNLQR